MNFEKVIVAPQIVIYKNIFKNSSDLINILQKECKESLISPWEKWYDNGYRKELIFYKNNFIKEFDSKNIKIEKKIAKEFCDILEFIRKDYFKDFGKNNAIWPKFIKNWNALLEEPVGYSISFFRYDILMAKMRNNQNNLFMDYHIDEFPILNSVKSIKYVATINVYLNDDYEGGELCMYDSISNKSYMYKPKPGDAIIMPSTSPFYHAVKNFYKKDRYFMRSFFSYHVNGIDLDYDAVEKEKDEYAKNNLQQINILIKETLVN